jgi:hypothetical protein
MDETVEGFGESTLAELMELRKALDIGYTLPATGTDVIRVESLDTTLRLLTYSSEHTVLWRDIDKSDASSTVEEYNQLLAYGSEGGGFVSSGQTPEEDDSTYARANQKVKYIGTTRSVNHPATLIKTVPADIVAQETNNGVLWLLGKIERALFWGDENVIPVEWNGIVTQLIAGGVPTIDLQGQPLGQDDVENGTQSVVDNFGRPTRFYSAFKVFSDFTTQYYTYQRFAQPGSNPGYVGTPLLGVNTQAGKVDFVGDTFLKTGVAPPASATNSKAPSAPTISMAAPGATAGSQFLASDAGTYKYQVTAVNKYGESPPSALSAGTAYALGDGAVLTITDGGGTFGATGYRIYRGEKNAATLSTYITQVGRALVSGVYQATTTWTEKNEWRSNCYVGLLLDMSPQAVTFKQLAPLLKMPLAIISPAIRWMQLLYGTPIVYAPKKHVLYKNIGKAS